MVTLEHGCACPEAVARLFGALSGVELSGFAKIIPRVHQF